MFDNLTAATRWEGLPDLPTVNDFVPGFEMVGDRCSHRHATQGRRITGAAGMPDYCRSRRRRCAIDASDRHHAPLPSADHQAAISPFFEQLSVKAICLIASQRTIPET
jgi:hypothetical protein